MDISGEGAPHNILVNSLHIGVIVSDQIVSRHRREGANVSLDDFIAQRASSCRWAAWGGPRNFPSSPASSPPT
jgi:hypothetical protein